MAYLTTDPMEAIIAEGRIKPRPILRYGAPEVLTVDLDLMAASLQTNLELLFLYDHRVGNRYGGSFNTAKHCITADITAMVDYAVGQTYNHLRTVLEGTCPSVRAERMNTRCPIPTAMEFPTWISSTLSSIGRFRLGNTLAVYASAASNMNSYGRKNKPVFADGNYSRLMQVLKEFGVATAPFSPPPHPLSREWSSYFPTIQAKVEEDTWQLYGCVHESNYENEDVARIALVTSDVGVSPFEHVGAPAGGGAEADRYCECLLAQSIASTELLQMLRYRIMRTSTK